LLGLIFNGSTATGVLRHSSARTPPDSDEEDELNDALLRFGMHVSARGNAGVGDGAGVGSGYGGAGGSGGGTNNGGDHVPPTNRGIVIGGNGRSKRPVDNSGASSDSKRRGKGKASSSSIDSLRSDALKEFCDLSRLRREILIQDQQRMSSGEGSAGAAGSGASYSNTMSRAISILDEIAPDLDDARYLKAFDLFKDESTRNGFIALAPARKKAWVASL
jgi:hypothetical protein